MKLTNNNRRTAIIVMAMLMVAMMAMPAFAKTPQGADLEQVVNPVVDLINSMLNPLLAVVGAVGALYCIILGVKYARAEEPQDREKAKSHLKNALIGFVLIFVLLVVLKILMPVLTNWSAQDWGKTAK